jgi:hypothetical protein
MADMGFEPYLARKTRATSLPLIANPFDPGFHFEKFYTQLSEQLPDLSRQAQSGALLPHRDDRPIV